MIRQRLTGLAATVGIAVLLVGLPALLLQVGLGNLPTITDWSDVVALLLRRDDGTLALVVIKALGWVTWAMLGGLILLEIVTRIRGVQPRDLPGLHLPQVAARQLVAAAAALFVALPGPTLAYADPLPAPASIATVTAPPAPQVTASHTAPHTAEDTAPPVQTRQHTVKRGESLWSIAAAELGNGRRYTEIAALNTRLLDGKGDDFLRAGWVLALPVGGTDSTTNQAPTETYTVREGDTLSEIAHDHLGDAQAFPKIVEASRTITQPGGRHLTNPDVIDVGWTLAIPQPRPDTGQNLAPVASPTQPTRDAVTPEPVVEEPVTHELPAPAEPAVMPAASPIPSAPEPAPVQTTRAVEAADTSTVTVDEAAPIPGWLVPGLVGAGSLLAGSLWVALGHRRAAQLRARRPGRMIATPPPALDPIDKTLRTEGASAALDVAFLDEALRRLASRRGRAGEPMPHLAAVEQADDVIRLHLADPADLREPWRHAPDRLRWELPIQSDLVEVGPLDGALPAPYPQLVTLGLDEGGHRWLYNLEEAGVLRVIGDPDRARDFVRHAATELAVHPWTRDVHVECVGIAAEAVAFNRRRVRHHDTADITAHVIADTVAMIDRTREAGLDIHTGRATLLDDPLWDSRLLLLDTDRTDLTEQLARLLNDQPRQTGTALMMIDVDGGHEDIDAEVLRVTGDGRLQLPGVGLTLTAAGLTARDTAGCAAIFAQADEPDVEYPQHPEPAEGWRAHTNQAGQLLPEHIVARDQVPDEPVTNVLPEIDEVYVDAAAVTPDDLTALAPHIPESVRELVEQDDPTLDDDVSTWFDPSCDLPKLMLLGPLTVRVAPTGTPTAAVDRKPYFSELLAFLATRPHGATTEEVADAMGIPSGRVRKDVLALRTWLGVNPRTGRPHVPDSRQTTAASVRGRAAYQVEDLLVDADLFRRLRARGEARGSAGLDDLRRALSLVSGTPFGQLRRNGGTWLSEGQRLDQVLLCSIVDVTHLVTTASLALGDHAAAQKAAQLAVRVAPAEETAQLDLAAALASQGHHRAAEQLLRENVFDRSDDEDEAPTEIPARTEQIIDNNPKWLARRSTRASA